MPSKPSKLSQFWQELKRRRVIHVITVYASVAFVLIELVNNLTEPLNLPTSLSTIVIIVLAVGFPLAIVLSWLYDLTGEGFERTKPLDEVQDEKTAKVPNAWKIATYVSFVVIAGLLTFNIIGGPKGLMAGDIQSLLVLPFDNFTGDDQLDYITAGMHSSLIGDMGQIGGLRIISKTTANIYKNLALSLPEIATQANADAIVEPSVMCYGDSVCLQIKVITPFPEEKQIWMGEYKAEKSQILNVYNNVCKQIAQEIKITLTPSEEKVLAQAKTVNPDAYDAYLKGQYYWDQLTPEALQMALEYFNKAIEIDPNWAPPYAGVALFWMGVRQMGLAPSSITVPNLYKYLNKSIELDPNSALTHFITAGTAVWTGYEWDKGEREFLKVIELNPNDAANHAYYAHLLLFLKRPDEALTQAQTALELDPLNPLIQGLVAVVYWHIGNYNEAIALANQIRQLVPNHPLAIGVLWGANEALGNYEESLEYCVRLFMLDEETSALVLDTYKDQGYAAALAKMVSILEAIPDEQIPVSAAIRIAWMYLRVDNPDKALDILEKVLEEQGPDLPYVTTGNAQYKGLEREPRFLAIIEKMGLPPPAAS
jgi:tetratricopeptide (TPR) repeat protein